MSITIVKNDNPFTEKSLREELRFPFCPKDPDEPQVLNCKTFTAAKISISNYKWNWHEGHFLTPKFERCTNWDKKHMDSFIESLLLGMPTPCLTFYTDYRNNRSYLIDGYQRTRALLLFLKEFPSNYALDKSEEDVEGFKLDKLHILSKWHDMTCDDLQTKDNDTFNRLLAFEININFLQLNESSGDVENLIKYMYHMYRKFSSNSYE